MDHAAVAERFIAAKYPNASIAIVAGNSASSDIDLLLIGDNLFSVEGQSNEASTHLFEHETFEVLAYTTAGFKEWAERGIAQNRPVIVNLLVEGVPIRGDNSVAILRRTWQEAIDAGSSLSADESRFRRYVITDVLDDLRDASDPLEQLVVASVLFEKIAELMLLSDGQSVATGKWLARRLRDLSRVRAERLSDPLLAGDYKTFADRVEDELELAGGPMRAGFVR